MQKVHFIQKCEILEKIKYILEKSGKNKILIRYWYSDFGIKIFRYKDIKKILFYSGREMKITKFYFSFLFPISIIHIFLKIFDSS